MYQVRLFALQQRINIRGTSFAERIPQMPDRFEPARMLGAVEGPINVAQFELVHLQLFVAVLRRLGTEASDLHLVPPTDEVGREPL